MKARFALACVAAVLASAPLPSQEYCCSARLNTGFSTELLRGAPPFEGIEGLGAKCDASGGVVDHIISGGPQRVYLNVVSNMQPEFVGVQGWSLIVALTGDGDLLSATTAGTAADHVDKGGLFSGGFNKTEVLGPPGKGALTGVVLSLREGTTLPLQGTESVLALELNGPDEGTSDLTIAGGLRCCGLPITSVFTVGGDSMVACNQRTAAIRIRHIASRHFIRGNANADEGLDIADAVWILNELFHEGRPSPCADAADSNDDGRVDISDPVYVVSYLFLTGSAPPPPFEECGLDLTEDEIGCVGLSETC